MHGVISHAAYRASELCQVYDRLGNGRPTIEIGCGDGTVAGAWLVDRVDLGVDCSKDCARRAAKSNAYRSVCVADARQLPLDDETFSTAVSISVLEHTESTDMAVRECFRVLQRGGRCVMTIALADLHEWLFYPALLRRLRLAWLARAYVRLHDRAFKHVHLRSRKEWEREFEAAGFRIVECRKICSPRLTRLWDAMLPLAVPGWLLGKLGLPAPRLPRFVRTALWRRFQPLIEEDTGEGSSLLIVAEKPGGEAE